MRGLYRRGFRIGEKIAARESGQEDRRTTSRQFIGAVVRRSHFVRRGGAALLRSSPAYSPDIAKTLMECGLLRSASRIVHIRLPPVDARVAAMRRDMRDALTAIRAPRSFIANR